MALSKEILTPTRAQSAYQKISKIEINAAQGTVMFTISMYVDAEARAANLPIWHDYVTVPLSSFTTDLLAIGYEVLTSIPDTAYHGAPGDATAPASMVVGLKPDVAIQ